LHQAALALFGAAVFVGFAIAFNVAFGAESAEFRHMPMYWNTARHLRAGVHACWAKAHAACTVVVGAGVGTPGASHYRRVRTRRTIITLFRFLVNDLDVPPLYRLAEDRPLAGVAPARARAHPPFYALAQDCRWASL
jgi:hypothetical protein